MAMKNIDNRHFAVAIADFILSAAKISKDYSGRKFFRLIMKYLLVAQKGDNIAEVVENAVQSINDKEFGEVGMILALQLKERGRLQGLKEGELKGEREGKLDVAARLLETGQDPAYVKEVTGLDDAAIEDLKKRLS